MFILNRKYQELVLYRAVTALKSETSRTYLNFLWWIFEPILTMMVFYTVFAVLFQRPQEDFVAFLLIGLVVWRWFGNTANHAGLTIPNEVGIINQINIPKVFFPTVDVMLNTLKFLLVFAILLIWLVITDHPFGWSHLSLIPLLLAQILLILGVSYVLAAIIPFVLDLNYLVGSMIQLTYFLSGIFYSGQTIPEQYRDLFYLNPMASLIHQYRIVLLEGAWPEWTTVGWIAFFGMVLIQIGEFLVARFDQMYPRVITR